MADATLGSLLQLAKSLSLQQRMSAPMKPPDHSWPQAVRRSRRGAGAIANGFHRQNSHGANNPREIPSRKPGQDTMPSSSRWPETCLRALARASIRGGSPAGAVGSRKAIAAWRASTGCSEPQVARVDANELASQRPAPLQSCTQSRDYPEGIGSTGRIVATRCGPVQLQVSLQVCPYRQAS